MNIRKATFKDYDAIRDLNIKLFKREHELFDDTISLDWPKGKYGEDYYKDSITSQNSLTLIAEEGDKIVGYMIAGKEETPDYMDQSIKIVELENMFIEEKYRRKGIGKLFVNELENWAKDQGCNTIKIIASYKNECSRNFYSKIGAIETEVTYMKKF